MTSALEVLDTTFHLPDLPLPAASAGHSPPPPSRIRHAACHLQAEWRDCVQAAEALRNADTLKRLCLRLCNELQLKVAGNAFFQFQPIGVTGTLQLEGSHLAIHTWPERNMLKADIHLQNKNGKDDESAALVLMEHLKSCFQPAFSSIDSGRRSSRLNASFN
jgi:S-adenosylmethionine/arginine decarboxylase-like enzyme